MRLSMLRRENEILSDLFPTETATCYGTTSVARLIAILSVSIS